MSAGNVTFLAPATEDREARLASYVAIDETSPAAPAPVLEIGERLGAHKTRVLIESPFAGASAAAFGANQLYGRAALRDSLLRGEAPMASHMLYAQKYVLDDNNPDERSLGMLAGFSWLPYVEKVVVYVDRGISAGMREGIRRATELGIDIEERSIDIWARS